MEVLLPMNMMSRISKTGTISMYFRRSLGLRNYCHALLKPLRDVLNRIVHVKVSENESFVNASMWT